MRYTLALALTLTSLLTLRADERPSVGLATVNPGESPAIEVVGLPKEMLARLKAAKPSDKDWHPIFRVVVAGGTNEEVLARAPLAGSYTLTATGARFEPQFPLVPGREYVAIVHDIAGGKPQLTSVAVPKPPPGPRVAISTVYPSATRVPENMLRFYIHFSGPVARGDVYRHLKLVRDDGVQVKDPFLELPEELWANEGNRLTVFFHPGRVKHGLVPHEEEGPILEEGRRYTLIISDKWQDTEGRPIVAEYRKKLIATAADEQPIDLADWALIAPRSRSTAPLIVKLHKPLDHALLNRVVWVVDADGKRVPGTMTVGGGERVLTFAPENAWARGDYQLVAGASLEDVCGNRVGRSFEVSADTPAPPKGAATAERKFTVR